MYSDQMDDLDVLAACVHFGGGVLHQIGRIVEILFTGSSILCLIMGQVSGREFWEMFFLWMYVVT